MVLVPTISKLGSMSARDLPIAYFQNEAISHKLAITPSVLQIGTIWFGPLITITQHSNTIITSIQTYLELTLESTMAISDLSMIF